MDTVQTIFDLSKRIVTDFGTPLISILICAIFITAVLFLASWYLTKRQIGKNSENIPAGVIKNYLDSIIDNSIALRSSIFREKHDRKSSTTISPMHTHQSSESKQNDSSRELQELKELKEQLSKRDEAINKLEKKLRHGHSKQEDEIQNLKAQILKLKEESSTPNPSTAKEVKKKEGEPSNPSAPQARKDTQESLSSKAQNSDQDDDQDNIVVEYQDQKGDKDNKDNQKDEKDLNQKLMDKFEEILS